MGLRLTTQPSVEPVSLSEARENLSLASGDHDVLLRSLIVAARRRAEAYTQRAFISQGWRLTLDEFPVEFWLPRPPLISVSSIKYIDTDGATQTLASSVYRVTSNTDPARVTQEYQQTWPTPRHVTECVEVNYTAGYGTDPADVPGAAQHAILLLVAEWFDHPAAAEDGSTVRAIPHGAEWCLNGLRTGAGSAWQGLPDSEHVSR